MSNVIDPQGKDSAQSDGAANPQRAKQGGSADNATFDPEAFDIETFFPYLVRIYYKSVSQAIKDVYTVNHGLSASEWRTMAVIGRYQKLTAQEIISRSSMDKVSVSRAVSSLRRKHLMTQYVDTLDRRRSVLELTEEGRKVHADLIPPVEVVEQQLLADLSPEEHQTLLRLMAKVRASAELISAG